MTNATTPAASRVCMDLHPGERVVFAGTGVEVELVHKSGRAARLRVTSPRAVSIERERSDDAVSNTTAMSPSMAT